MNNKINDNEAGYTEEQVDGYVKSINWEKRFKKEVPFLKQKFEERKLIKILDLGCGPGKHAMTLSREGFKITGIDISEGMINYAKKSAEKEQLTDIEFLVKNVFDNDPDLKEKFDGLYTLGNALMIIWTSLLDEGNEDKLVDIFKSLNYVLRAGGGLFFQILNSDNPRDGHVLSKITESNGTKQMLVKHFIPILSENKLYTTFTSVKWNDNLMPEIKHTRKGYLYLVPLIKLKEVLMTAGFTDLEYYEDYSGKKFNKDSSDSLLLFAIKK